MTPPRDSATPTTHPGDATIPDRTGAPITLIVSDARWHVATLVGTFWLAGVSFGAAPYNRGASVALAGLAAVGYCASELVRDAMAKRRDRRAVADTGQ